MLLLSSHHTYIIKEPGCKVIFKTFILTFDINVANYSYCMFDMQELKNVTPALSKVM